METTGILRGSSEAWNHKFNLIGVSLTKPFDVLAHFDAGPEHVVKAEIHLDDPRQIAGIEAAWDELFSDDPPARTFIPATFPTRSTIEIEFIAVDPKGPLRREVLQPDGLPDPVGREADHLG